LDGGVMRPRGTAGPRVAAAVVIANLQRLSRDRTGLVFIVLVPFLLIAVIGLSGASGGNGAWTVGLVAPESPDATTERLLEALDAEPTLALVRYDGVDAMTADVRRRELPAGIVVPPDLEARIAAGEVAVVRFHADPAALPPLALRTTVAQAVAGAAATLRSARVVADRTGISTSAALAASDLLPTFGTTDVEQVTLGSEGRRIPSGFDYAAPAYLVLFMFINTLVAAWGMPVDRAAGLTRRTVAAPARAGWVLAGEWVYRLLVALLQAALIVVVGGLFFGVRWGDPAAVAAIVTLFALASTGAAMLLGSWARSEAQVTSLAPPIGIGLGMLGGCMWPLEIVGPTMRAIGHATPHAWAVDAFIEVVGGGATLIDVGRELAVLAAFAVGLLGLALAVFTTQVRRARG
jgi:ABC-2 type transport system permease protein